MPVKLMLGRAGSYSSACICAAAVLLLAGCTPTIPQRPVSEFTDIQLGIYYGSKIRDETSNTAETDAIDAEVQRRHLFNPAETSLIHDKMIHVGMRAITAAASIGPPIWVLLPPGRPGWEAWIYQAHGKIIHVMDAHHSLKQRKLELFDPASDLGNIVFIGNQQVIGFGVKIRDDQNRMGIAMDGAFFDVPLQKDPLYYFKGGESNNWRAIRCHSPLVEYEVTLECVFHNQRP